MAYVVKVIKVSNRKVVVEKTFNTSRAAMTELAKLQKRYPDEEKFEVIVDE